LADPPGTKLRIILDKDKIYPENYRGITVTNTFSTVIEGILKERIEPKLLLSQNKLQRGFTQKACAKYSWLSKRVSPKNGNYRWIT
jgi:hypothetical protein